LKITNGGKIVTEMIGSDYELYKKIATNGTNRINQIGGNTKRIKYVFSYKGCKNTFIWYENKSDDIIQYMIYDKQDENNPEICVLCSIPIDHTQNNRFIYINNISSYPNCSIEGMPKTHRGTILMQMTLSFIKNYLQNRYNQINKKIEFDNLFMITRGDTWYGKYGFVPYDSDNNTIDIDNLVNYKVNQHIVKKTKIKCTNIDDYIRKAMIKLNYCDKQINKINKYIDKMQKNNVSVIDFMREFMNNYDMICDIFASIYKELMKELEMTNLHGKTYYLLLI
jgi:hypothetical protein